PGAAAQAPARVAGDRALDPGAQRAHGSDRGHRLGTSDLLLCRPACGDGLYLHVSTDGESALRRGDAAPDDRRDRGGTTAVRRPGQRRGVLERRADVRPPRLPVVGSVSGRLRARRNRRHHGPQHQVRVGSRRGRLHTDLVRVGRGLRAQGLMSRQARVGALVALGVVLGTLLIFAGLSQRYLWDDEAETALLAERVLQFGVPLAWDGASLVSQECGQDYDQNYVWRQTPWLPIYVTAASFKLFGVSTFAARLPFALLGLLSVSSMYLLARRVFNDWTTVHLAAASLLFSVPFLLHVRQCRYYSLAIFASIWILYFFFSLRERPRLAAAGLALSLTMLVHTSQLLFLGAVAGLVLGFLVARLDRAVLPWLGAGLGAAVALNFPWLVGSDLGGKSGNLLSLNSAALYLTSLLWYVTRIESYAFSAVLLVAALVVVVAVKWTRIDFSPPASK